MSEDLIRRSDAIKAIEAEECLGYVECQSEWLYDRIRKIPTIEPKHGKWIDKGADLDGTLYYQCSNCHADVIEEQYPNCPYCLARMKGADDE